MECFLHKVRDRIEVRLANETNNFYRLPLSEADIRADL